MRNVLFEAFVLAHPSFEFRAILFIAKREVVRCGADNLLQKFSFLFNSRVDIFFRVAHFVDMRPRENHIDAQVSDLLNHSAVGICEGRSRDINNELRVLQQFLRHLHMFVDQRVHTRCVYKDQSRL